ncbi:MAG TPA: peptidyl-alpha-hydroxyglycine alpha-amidating lyase family protein [Burkholderiales bacterium]|nr:peptidyl-alpha-hydroxyglycine alpha-amidating lyase family protein [Burkholderiales bacterium]
MRGSRSLIVTLSILAATFAVAQDAAWRTITGWAQMPPGRTWGSTSALDVDRSGNVWVFERCGANSCAESTLPPILQFDPAGKFVRGIGAGLFVFPHGIHVDGEGNIWVADALGKDGKGHVVVKFNREGKVLLTLGRPGVAGDALDTFNRPSAVITAPNGDIYVSDGHGGDSNARIVKFAKDGKFIKTWGKKGSGPGEFGELHGIALDSSGRVFVADRGNNRIQIFDADGKYLAEWKQFGRPSALYIDANDTLYVSDHASDAQRNPGVRRGIRVGSAKDGTLRTHIPGVGADPDKENVPEGIAADGKGSIYGAEVALKSVTKFVRN